LIIGVTEITEDFPFSNTENVNDANEKISPFIINKKTKKNEINVNIKENVYNINNVSNVNNDNDGDVDNTGVHCLCLLWRYTTKSLDQARSILTPKVGHYTYAYIDVKICINVHVYTCV
jgi:hypothetical protein